MTATMQLPYFYRAANQARVIVAMEIAPFPLRLQKVKGKLHAELNVVGAARSRDGAVAARFSDVVNLDFKSEKEAEAFMRRPYRYENQFDLAAGEYTFLMAFGAGERQFGKAEMPLVVEPWDSSRLSLSALAIAAGTRQVPNLASELDDALLQDRRPLLAGSLETTPAANNHCSRSSPCQAYMEVYVPVAESKGPAPVLQVRILDRRQESRNSIPGYSASLPTFARGAR